MRSLPNSILAALICAVATVSHAAEPTDTPPRVLIIGKNGLSTNLAPDTAQAGETTPIAAGIQEITNPVPLEAQAPEPLVTSTPPAVVTVDWEPIVQAMQLMIDQQKTTLQAMEQTGREANETSRRQTESMEKKLSSMEDALAAQRTHESDTINRMNRLVVGVAASFAGAGFVIMVLTAWFFMRTMNKVAEINANVQSQLLALPHTLQPLVGSGDGPRAGAGGGQPANQRLLGALEQLERRIRDLEHSPAEDNTAATNGQGHGTTAPASPTKPGNPPIVDMDDEQPEGSSVATLLARGQTLLNLDEAEQALECFDAALQQEPGHAEALLKKGTALERLRRMHEALEAYDGAIRSDDSMTMAYLAKGGICNRLERYSEALECYEKALRTQQATPA